MNFRIGLANLWIGLWLLLITASPLYSAEQSTIHGRIELVEDRIFLVENPESTSRTAYLIMGELAAQIRSKVGAMARIIGETEMESKTRWVLTAQEYLILTPPEKNEGSIPSEDLIAFAAIKQDRKGVYLIKPDGSDLKKISTVNGDYANICWSQDGGFLLYDYSNELTENPVLYTVSMANKRARPHNALVSRPSAKASHFGYSPDGTQQIVSKEKDGKKQLYLLNLLTGKEKKLSDGKGNDIRPVWSGDGSRIAYISDRDGTNWLYLMDVSKKKLTLIQTNFAVFGPIDWTHDQDHIALLHEQTVHLVSIKKEGGIKKLTDGELKCYEVSCAP